MVETSKHERIAVSWACATLAKAGATLYSVGKGWDVELRNGEWRAANTVGELCAVAKETLR